MSPRQQTERWRWPPISQRNTTRGLVLLTVLPPLPSVAPDTASILGRHTGTDRHRPPDARQRAERLRTEGRSVGHLVEIGDPTERLLDLADSPRGRVTVLGRSGKGADCTLSHGERHDLAPSPVEATDPGRALKERRSSTRAERGIQLSE
jgi:hypothetical protein